ncbi:hypothetical protein HUN59_14720 [Curtobacterium sp. Csp2]|uniref:Acb2/Tad1 domain-containing protein n=1 Tax=Curtobacterium sp. Csp2 TaxID=2495430 RepID=UPI001581298B|nr:hypothetical protein [Curtobacterium sp. Csp2]QKS17294.1 hypothetical protein HUN59_14720 [Curtobacterium sp. Csp2]
MPQIPDHFIADFDSVETPADERITGATNLAEERFFTASEKQEVVTLRKLIQELGTTIDLVVPPGRNKALALTALEDVQMRANRGIFAPEHLR